MERLTEKTIGCFEYRLKEHKPVVGEFGTYEAFFDYSMAVRALGKYEDAEESGLLVVLPCKVGDTVYTVDLDCRDNPHQSEMCFCWNKSCKDCDKAYLRVWENHTKTANVRSIVSEMGLCGEKGGFGKTVFLTREEAEEALKGAEHE